MKYDKTLDKLKKDIDKIMTLEEDFLDENEAMTDEYRATKYRWFLEDLKDFAESDGAVEYGFKEEVEGYIKHIEDDYRKLLEDENNTECDSFLTLLYTEILDIEEGEEPTLIESLKGAKGIAEILRDCFYNTDVEKDELYENVVILNNKLDEIIEKAEEGEETEEHHIEIDDEFPVRVGEDNYCIIAKKMNDNTHTIIAVNGEQFDELETYNWAGSFEAPANTTFIVKCCVNYSDKNEFVRAIKDLLENLKNRGTFDSSEIIYYETTKRA